MLTIQKIIPFLFIVALSNNCAAQDSTKTFQFAAALGFTSVPTFTIIGIDTTYRNSLSVAPVIEIRNKNGLGISYSPKFVAGGSSGGIYVHELTAGLERYDKSLFDIVADYSHYFFTGNKSIPATPITNELYFSGTYKKPWVRPTLTLGYGFGSEKVNLKSNNVNEINLSGGISHIFQKDVGDATFSFIPGLKLNAGTNSYFSLLRSSPYVGSNKNYRSIVNKKKRNGTVTNPTTTVSKKTFTLNNAEAEFQGSFDKGSFNARPGVSIIVPFSSDNSASLIWQIDFRYYF